LNCPRCAFPLRLILTVYEQGACESLSCGKCGYVEDEAILRNRLPEIREYWRVRTDQEEKIPLSRAEKIIQEFTEAAIRFSF